MSLGISVSTSAGICLAADSRQTYRNRKGAARVGSDSAQKVFQIGERVGVVVAGPAFLREGNELKNVSHFVENFRATHELHKMDIEEIAKKIKEYFGKKYQYKQQLDALQERVKRDLVQQGAKLVDMVKKDGRLEFEFTDAKGVKRHGVAGVDQLQFIVAGFNRDDSHQVCISYVPGVVDLKRDSQGKITPYGADWIGQADVVTRTVLGFDNRIFNLPIVQKAVGELGETVVRQQLSNLEYVIQFGTMTLQDAVDFSTLAIETTTAIQRFSDGVIGNPGDIPGVGGPVDVAVITREHGFVWLNKKNLRVGEREIDLEEMTAAGAK